ncbi:UDP-N-acetyl-alpha-D-glucosamine C6 dehydratase [compost metagenome]
MPFDIRGFISYHDKRVNIKLLGKNIITKEIFINTLKDDSHDISGVLVIKETLQKEELDFWVNVFLENKLKIYKAPSMQKLRSNEMINHIKTIQIEDLLNRRPIKLDNLEIKKRHFQKTVLVTGGAGSIGREIVRQVALLEPLQIVVLDQSETPLYETELEMRETYPHINFKFVLADISNFSRLEPIFTKYNFSMVYHAAAYKHVPLVEENPHEAVLVNVMGTKNLARLSSKYAVNRFVMVSTDKAVNPTNVMGASKRVAELFVQSLQNVEGNSTKFITTRFGNVLGSNGSVIPHFKKQIEKGGPVTITHPDIVRYFMTIAEACELVLNAGTMGQGGEIYVFDMGEPVKIIDLAKRMIKLSGFEPDIDIKIIYTGLRPGEKLYEELLSDNTRTLPTSHEKIMISKDPSMHFEEIDGLTELVIEYSRKEEKQEIVRILKSIVKEFKSNNSIYESLDN